jgi:WD40-like Beta Propeller Repeat
LADLPLSVRLIREIHAELLKGVRGSRLTPGELRRSQNWIGPGGCTLSEATFVPPPPAEVPTDARRTWDVSSPAGRPAAAREDWSGACDAAPYSGLALSPDERRVAVTLETGAPTNVDIWLIDVTRNVRSRLTVHPGQEVSPVWSPDSARIAFQSSRSRQPIALRQTLSSETGKDELLLEGQGNFTMTPSGWSSNGQFIAYTTRGSNIWILPLFGDWKPFPFADTAFTEASAVFSPDGPWIAYTSNEGGQAGVYVRSFPGPGAKSRVSRSGGSHPVWRADGRELFYLGPDGTMMSVPIGAGPFEAGLPRALFHANVWTPGSVFARLRGSASCANRPVRRASRIPVITMSPQDPPLHAPCKAPHSS